MSCNDFLDRQCGLIRHRAKLGWRIALVGFASLLVSSPGTAAPTAAFDRRAWNEDYAFLKAALERDYANLAWFASPQGGIDIPALDRRALAELERAQDDRDAKAALLAFVAGFHDGHFSQVPYLQAAAAGPADDPPNPDFAKLDAAAGCAALGYASTKSVPFSLPFETLGGFALESDGIATPFRAGTFTTPQGMRIGLVRIRLFRQHEYPVLCLRQWAAFKASNGSVDTKALQSKVDLDWFASFAEQLQRFRTDRVAAVIVDVGDNSGGNDSGDWMPRLLTEQPVHSSRLWLAASASAKGYADEVLGDLNDGIKALGEKPVPPALQQAAENFRKRKAEADTRHCDMSWVWKAQRPWTLDGCNRLVDMGYASGPLDYSPAATFPDSTVAEKMYWAAVVDPWRGAWNGPVYVLTDRHTFSSAEMFAATLRNNNVAKVVGSATGGDGCGFMQDEHPVVLPHSRLRFRIPDCVRLRADGTDEVAGIQPDVPVLPTEGESGRARAQRVLGAVEADMPAAAAH